MSEQDSESDELRQSPEAETDDGPQLILFDANQAGGPPAHAQSPSIRSSRGKHARAHEVKFLVDESLACDIEARLRGLLSPDPHADPTLEQGYRIATLYCDTPRWDMYHRVGRHGLFKFRFRRYGQSGPVFLERKSKRKSHVRKKRTIIELAELSRFDQLQPSRDWNGAWYHRQILRNELRPVCLLEYHRLAYFGLSTAGPIRLTFDRQIVGGLTDLWSFAMPSRLHQVLSDKVVCEFKYRGALPAVFKSTMQELKLVQRGVSKYRHCILSSGAIANSEGADARLA